MAKISKKKVNQLGQSYHNARRNYGENNLATVRAMIAYYDAIKQWEKENGKTWGK